MSDYRFKCCETCVFVESDGLECSDCDEGDGYEFDESLIEIQEDGRMGIRQERLAA